MNVAHEAGHVGGCADVRRQEEDATRFNARKIGRVRRGHDRAACFEEEHLGDAIAQRHRLEDIPGHHPRRGYAWPDQRSQSRGSRPGQ